MIMSFVTQSGPGAFLHFNYLIATSVSFVVHGWSPSTKVSHTVAFGTGLVQGPSDNDWPVCREITLFVLTILRPVNGLFTAENSDPVTLFFSLI